MGETRGFGFVIAIGGGTKATSTGEIGAGFVIGFGGGTKAT